MISATTLSMGIRVEVFNGDDHLGIIISQEAALQLVDVMEVMLVSSTPQTAIVPLMSYQGRSTDLSMLVVTGCGEQLQLVEANSIRAMSPGDAGVIQIDAVEFIVSVAEAISSRLG